MNCIDRLIENTIKTKNPTVVGLDPDIGKVPTCYKNKAGESEHPLAKVADVILDFNRDIIDTVCDLVPAIKPQIAFYEKYGSYGVAAFEKTVEYAKSKGLVVIEDAKRGDIGNTAKAYADAHLGEVETLDGSYAKSFDADFLTVNPYLGSESLKPFVDVCRGFGKGIFVLVKTSNISSGEIQDVVTKDGKSISQFIAEYVNTQGHASVGRYGYSSIGAVVGATYPEEAVELRKSMPHSSFLVPGYGAQGGEADDILPCFNSDGLGAIINSSRGILFTHMNDIERNNCCKEIYLKSVRQAVISMRNDIYHTLKNCFANMLY